MSARGSVLIAGDEKDAEGGGGCYCKGDVGGDILLVDLSDGVERGIAEVGTNVDDTNDNVDDSENDKAEGEG